MTAPPDLNHHDEIALGVEQVIKAVNPAALSDQASSMVKAKVIEYLSDLVKESEAVRKRDNVESISLKHIEIASENLILRSRNKIFKLAGTIGGLLLGTSLSTLCAMMLVSQFPVSGIWISTCSGIVGGFLLAVSFIKDYQRL
jgi:hypothetical protein